MFYINKQTCMSLSQVKLIHVFIDDAAISPSEGFLIRKGPGNCHFDFAQEILFIDFLQTPTDNKSSKDQLKYGAKKESNMRFFCEKARQLIVTVVSNSE